MSKQKGKKDFKKPVVKQEDFIEEDNDKKSIILILIAIIAIIGLIVASVFFFKKEEETNPGGEGEPVDIILPVGDSEEEAENKTKKVALATKKYVIRYLDVDGNQIGKTQRVLDLEDRVNEKPPKIECKRFREWSLNYDSIKDVYYYIATYVDNVERVPLEEETYLENNDNYEVTVKKVEQELEEEAVNPNVMMILNEIEEELITNPTYEVEVTGQVLDTDISEINDIISETNPGEQLTISENFSHIIALRFNAPEDVTKEDIENMFVNVYKAQEDTELEADKYHYNGEELNEEGEKKTGRDLLDSTDEEYENNIFYFNYYQEVDTEEETIVEVYWGNDPEADKEALPEPIEPKEDYIELYEINIEEVEILESLDEVVIPEVVENES